MAALSNPGRGQRIILVGSSGVTNRNDDGVAERTDVTRRSTQTIEFGADRCTADDYVMEHCKSAAMAGHAPGAPLLTIGDLLRDLSERPSPPRPSQEEPDSPETIRAKKIAFLNSYLQPDGHLPKAKPPTLPPQSSLEGKNLVEAFEKIFADLMKVMNELHDNNTWIGLTEQLSTTLTTADNLIASANKEVGPLLDKVSTLHALVERGQAALARLQMSMSQTVQH